MSKFLLLVASSTLCCLLACKADSENRDESSGDPGASLLGATYPPLRLPPEVKRQREAELEAARSRVAAYPGDRDAWIWVGRRLAYLGRFREAIDTYGAALLRFPDDARLLRHRGHRHMTLREFDAATADLRRAAERSAGQPDEVELDGLPNPRNEPRTTLHGNIWYHLGLVSYLQGRNEEALAAWERGLAIAGNDDAWVASAYWIVLVKLRQGDDPATLLAEVSGDMDVIENQSYHALLRVFRGDLDGQALLEAAPPDSVDRATIGYGLAAWDLANGRPEQGIARCREIVAGSDWHAFGHIAAEAELSRRAEPPALNAPALR